MSRVADLDSRRASLSISASAAVQLERVASDLLELASRLALAGPWREWGDGQPVGTEIDIRENALRQCDDPSIRAVLATMDAALHAASCLRGKSRRGA